MTKQELHNRLLFFQPEILFAGTTGGLQLVMDVDAFNDHISWCVVQGDHYSEIMNFDEAVEEFLACGGDEAE